ncbi:MAG: hypothetical protein GAK33_01222 [Burkholderia lata]|uniref:Lipopolysaccharide assembly protein B n=1 Tax=Burkholderia lata (strain ATCC 17760 / DSM 23089 / LMG 22485 / NCIMB 9086 / R18194 / 383) TaxID=482957 RepID=A0A833PW10_BURL3|nr:hypothetical protein [Burkholderia lata]KAF1039383.1 MAG: hypothetical protein GAK33_01222 [Burkholderia lata]
MRVLPNRTLRARDDWRAILNARAEARRTASFQCKECGFVAFRALEHCPVCGRWNWPFDPISLKSNDTHAPHSFHTWSSRIARALRNAAFHRPRASSAPILSILTLVLLVGGYVVVDRTCKADPVCRGSNSSNGSNSSGMTASHAALYASNDPVLPVLPAPVYPFHSTDGTQVATARHSRPDVAESAGRTEVAQAAPAMRAPDRSHTAATVRVADWKGSRIAAHRSHAIRRVSMHTAHARRAAAGSTQIAQLYRGH